MPVLLLACLCLVVVYLGHVSIGDNKVTELAMI